MKTKTGTEAEPDIEMDLEPLGPPAPLSGRMRTVDLERVGRGALFLVISFCLLVLGVPLLLLSLVKSPERLQDVFILGASYHQLVSAFLLSAAITAYICVFFLKTGFVPVLVFFALSVFSCFPLVAGLRNNLSLQQAIVELPFFRSWPSFLRPGYILIEFLIPAAIAACLVLQIRNLRGRKPYRLTFLLVAAYLGIAAYFGFSALAGAGQPTLVNALSWMREAGREQPTPGRAEFRPAGADDPGKSQAPAIRTPPAGTGKVQTASGSEAGVELDTRVQILSFKVDRILQILTQTGAGREVQQAAAASAGGEARKEPSPTVPPAHAAMSEPAAERPGAEDFGSRLQTATEKMERILETLTRIQAVSSLPRDNAPGGKAAAGAKPASETPSDTPSGIQPVKEPVGDKPALEDLSQRLQVLSEKMDRVMESVDKVERRLYGAPER